MLVLLVVLSTVAAVLVACVLPRWADSPSQEPLASFDTRAAAANERIATLHRELGIDPIYDPVPTTPEPLAVSTVAPPPLVEGGEVMAPSGHALKVYTCPRCEWAMSAGKTLATESFGRHWRDKHASPTGLHLMQFNGQVACGDQSEGRMSTSARGATTCPQCLAISGDYGGQKYRGA